MSSYPIVHTKKNPVRVAVIQDSLRGIQKGIISILNEEDYVDIHDMQVNYCGGDIHSAIILYKTKYKGEVVSEQV